MRKERRILAMCVMVGAFAGLLLLGSLTPAHAKKVFRMKIESAYPRGDLSMLLLNQFAKDVDKYTNGGVKISVFADPELVPAEQLFEATQKGTLDMFQSVGAMWAGIVPVGEVEFGLPFAYNIGTDIVKSGAKVRQLFYQRGLIKLLRKEYAKHGLYYLDMHSYGEMFLLSTKPIVSCDDFKGLKIRAEGSWAPYFDLLGAHGVFIPGSDAYMGLKLGTIDASIWDVSAVVGLHWNEVAPYWVQGATTDAVVGSILMNMKAWESLPPEYKKAFHKAAEKFYHDLLQVYVGQMKKVYDLVKEKKLTITKLDPECYKKCDEAAKQIDAEVAKKDAVAAEAIAMIQAWRKTLK
jgi:TRAP-type C4-dicarboxylate transport system substrate-binding protein